MKYLFSLLIICVMSSCSKSVEVTKVNIRLKNISEVDFESTSYNSVDYGELKSSESTEYVEFESSYRYGAVSISIDGETYGWVPIDFVGETLLENGNYTFEYDFDESTQMLSDELIKD